jgi:hypothetical protein
MRWCPELCRTPQTCVTLGCQHPLWQENDDRRAYPYDLEIVDEDGQHIQVVDLDGTEWQTNRDGGSS